MKKGGETDALTFWEHLDELRGCLIRMALAVLACGIAAFCFKETLFDILLAPKHPDFPTYRLLDSASRLFLPDGGIGELPPVRLINTGLASQFVLHVQASIYAGVLCVSPYLLYLLFRFVSPALYSRERRFAIRLVGGGYVMFMLGVALSYFLIFPLTFRFLGGYQVSPEVENTVTLQSYLDTQMMLSLTMGIVFEIPLLCHLLSRFGLLTRSFMRRYRRHAVIAILLLAAVITPTSDVFTLLLVALPIWLLYEASIFLVRR